MYVLQFDTPKEEADLRCRMGKATHANEIFTMTSQEYEGARNEPI